MVELLTCPNCFTVFADVQDRCPQCEADRDGAGGRLELDTTARTAVAHLGGLYGGILEVGADEYVLWCARGVCLVSEEAGLVWASEVGSRVDGVSVGRGGVRVESRGSATLLDLRDGAVV